MVKPRFSILVACYNQRQFVEAAVESAITQSYQSKEVIVVDDCSSDGTPEVLDGFGDLIRLVKFEKNQGAIAARNHISSLASGEYLVFLDGDDVFLPWTLNVYDRLIESQNPNIILGKRLYFDGEVPKPDLGRIVGNIDFVDYQCWFQKDRLVAFGASNFVVNRKVFWDAGGWSSGIFHLDMSDLLMKLGLSGKTLVILSPETVNYRKHSTNVTNQVNAVLQCAHVLLKKERMGEYPGGRKHWFARATCLGGPMFFWIKRAVKTGLYVEAMKLAAPAGLTILAAIVHRLIAIGKRRRPIQTFELFP